MLNHWQQLKEQHPTQINAVNITDDKGNQGTFIHIRTVLFNKLTRREIMTPELIKFREKQNNASIDTLTNTLKSMDTDIVNLEKTLNNKYDEANITKEVLHNKLQDALNTLHPNKDNYLPERKANNDITTNEIKELFNEEST